MKYLVALDIGTTNVRTIVYTDQAHAVFTSSENVIILEPETGAAEINEDQLWSAICAVTEAAVNWAKQNKVTLLTMGVSCQRNTGTFWERKSGRLLHNFVTWQDIRCKHVVKEINSSFSLRALRSASSVLHFITAYVAPEVSKKFLAGAVIHYKPAMVAPRFIWLMRKLGCEKACQRGDVVWGTLDSWLIRRMNGKHFNGIHITEITHAAGSAIYDPFELTWSSMVCAAIGVPLNCLAKVVATCSTQFGRFEQFDLPIGSIAGDVNAAMIGEKMVNEGDIKVTMGTGAFVDINTGSYPFPSTTGCYPLVGWQLKEGGVVTYLAEADDNACGAAIDWGARAGFYETSHASEQKARQVANTQGVFFIPALWGITTPINDPTARCALLGIGPKTQQAHCVRAILHSVAFRSIQLIETLRKETKIQLRNLAVDGGVSQNNLICETISTLAQKQVNRPVDIEASARGATFFAGITAGIWDIETLPPVAHKDPIAPSNQKDFDNLMSEYTCWKDSIKRTLKWHELELDEQDPSDLCFKPELSTL